MRNSKIIKGEIIVLIFFLIFIFLYFKLGLFYFKSFIKVILSLIIILPFLLTGNTFENLALFFPLFLSTGIRYVFEHNFLVKKTPPSVPLFLHFTDFLAFFIFFYFIINYLISKKIAKDPLFKKFLFFFFSLFISTFYSYDKFFSLFHILMFFNSYLLYRFILDALIKKENNIKVFIWTYLIFLFFNIIIGIFQLVFGYVPLLGKEFMEVYKFEFKRIRGVFVHGNSLGGIIALTIPPYLSFYFSKELRDSPLQFKIIYFCFSFFLIFALFFTYSRNSLISSILGVIFFFFIYFWKIKKIDLFLKYLFLFLFSLLFIVFISKFISEKVYERILSIFRPFEDISFQVRIHYWVNSLRTFLKHPIFGIGISQFIYMPYAFLVIIPHNLYIQLLLETGIIGFFSFFLLIGTIMKFLFEGVKKNDPNEKYFWLSSGLLGSWITFLNHNLLDSSWTTINHNEEMKVLFIMITLSVFIYKKLVLNKISIN